MAEVKESLVELWFVCGTSPPTPLQRRGEGGTAKFKSMLRFAVCFFGGDQQQECYEAPVASHSCTAVTLGN